MLVYYLSLFILCYLALHIIAYIETLNAPFREELKSLLAYMSVSRGQEYYLFQNFLVIVVDLFNALDYFRSKGLVHRDMKRM